MPTCPTPATRTCTKCLETKPFGGFYQKTPRQSWCKSCLSAYGKARYRRNVTTMRANARVKSKTPKEMARQKARVRDRPWSFKDRAKNRVRYEVSVGKMIPADNCERCGHDFSESHRAGHHADYSKPLSVEWLCHNCHMKHHRRVI